MWIALKEFIAPTSDLGTYEFKYLNTVKGKSGNYFTYAYVDAVYESEQVCTYNKKSRTFLDANN